MQLDRRLFEGKLKSSIVYPEFFKISRSDHVANLACGVGPQVLAYKDSFAEMVCVDMSDDRLVQLPIFMQEHGVTGFHTVKAPVENTGLPENSFDKVLAIDIIEHLVKPEDLLREIHRILKPGARALVTIPVMHDRWTALAGFLRRIFTGKKSPPLPEGHPDRHNSDFSRKKWMKLLNESTLKVISVRATTLFPPLHLYGVPRFWFTVKPIHFIDHILCQIPCINRLGQAWMVQLEK